MLDPIKFGIVCPGMKADGQLDKNGIPADIVTAYLGRHGIVPSRTTDHMVLFLFSMGVTKGKWGTLLNTLLDFKVDYDRNAPLAEVVPGVVANAPERYAGMGLKDLGDEMWAHLRKSRQGHWQAQAYATLAEAGDDAATRIPAADGRRRRESAARRDGGPCRRGRRHPVSARHSDRHAGREPRPEDGPWLTYLRTLQEYGHLFPGFAKEVEGAEEHDGGYHVYCLK